MSSRSGLRPPLAVANDFSHIFNSSRSSLTLLSSVLTSADIVHAWEALYKMVAIMTVEFVSESLKWHDDANHT